MRQSFVFKLLYFHGASSVRRFESSELESVKKKFIEIAKKPASWLPFDALSAKYTLGDWCQFCEFKNSCAEYR